MMQTNLKDIIVGVEQTINAEYEKKEKSATDKKHYVLRDKTSG
ncbi:5625_t:CDS:2 [Rhizophagus irregularis]|nr:5623_t:CDS:2 [Rhizophagus irregularis]CAG8684323.1 5625_t:CDS:2 [Rhizophagus irregularis]